MVGLRERFDETALLLARTFGWRRPLYARQMVNRARYFLGEVPEAVRQRLADDNRLDAVLYADAQARFDGPVAAGGPAFRRDLAVFRLLNRLWQPWYRLQRTARRLRRIPARYQPLACSSLAPPGGHGRR